MSKFKDVGKAITFELENYAKGTLDAFLEKAAMDISGMSQYIFEGKKKNSLLMKNIDYLREANRNVKASVNDFTYYNEDGSVSSYYGKDGVVEKPVIVDPMNDKGNTIQDGFRPDTGVRTQGIENGYIVEGVYDEVEGDQNYNGNGDSYTIGFTKEQAIGVIGNSSARGIVKKTNSWFKKTANDYIQNRFDTIISRFHTSNSIRALDDLKGSVGSTAISDYGMSRGRNLLKGDLEERNVKENGYENPYCRVWTWHHQYSKLKDAIRPLGGETSEDSFEKAYKWNVFRSSPKDGFGGGGDRLGKYGVMYNNKEVTNGLVNITPQTSINDKDLNGENNVNLKHCMFSIENLAWKNTFDNYGFKSDSKTISNEQKGPLGGRIMWFPPYDLKFNEQSQARWDEVTFIGRGEPMYTYSNTNRTGTLSFKLLIDHPSIIDYWDRRNETATENNISVNSDDAHSKEQQLLRFFAGCSVLSAAKQSRGNTVNEDIKRGRGPKPQSPAEQTMTFIVYFPNNYSGVDDVAKEYDNSVIKPITYLLNGVGAQYGRASGSSVELVDIPTNTSNIVWKHGQDVVGGYETRKGTGISLINEFPVDENFATVTVSGATVDLYKYMKSKYCYRCDKSCLYENLNNISYVDNGSSCLNSTGYTSTSWNVNRRTLYSLADFYVAIHDESKRVLDGIYSDYRVSVIKKILERNIKRVHIEGWASSQGNNPSEDENYERNKRLAQGRAETVKKWLSSETALNGRNIEFESVYFVDSNEYSDMNDSNIPIARINRCAIVTVYYDTSEVEDAGKNVIGQTSEGTVSDYSISNENVSDKNGKEEVSRVKVSPAETVDKLGRYDNEAMFFDRLTREDPLIVSQINKKVKYFDPVFHSMSPEGFNARLNFLQQCMRQGPTYSAYQTDFSNADNLAFGRPPVCVLRVGDFYNTKIIINSLSINYDPLMWDLNQEGIGVMPMIADVSLSFTFIGGSDLGGPIQRLQNALSFNYYANSSVYDDRAEMIDYGNLGKVNNFSAFSPMSIFKDEKKKQ